MSENNEAVAVQEAPAAPKARKPRSKPAAKKPTAKKTESNGHAPRGLSVQRRKVLQALVKGGSMQTLVNRTKLDDRAVYHHLWHLRKDGHVKTTKNSVDGRSEMFFELTRSGNKLLS